MDNILHILINDELYDEEIGEEQKSVYSFFEALKRPFIQVKNASQFSTLIASLPDDKEVAVWVHPNASMKKSKNKTPPGEDSMLALFLDNTEFNVVSRYPDDVSKEILKDLGKDALKLGSLYKEIKNAIPVTVGKIKGIIQDGIPKGNVVPEGIDVAIIAALYDDEYKSLFEFVEDVQPVKGFDSLKIAKLKNSNKKVIIDFQARMGMVEATYLSTSIISLFKPKHIIMVGVCGGRHSKGVKLLDIIIPNKVFDYQTGKYENGQFKPYMRACNINNKRAIVASEEILKSMGEYLNGPLKNTCAKITIHKRTLACGNIVVKTNGYLEEEVSKFDEETEGVEMESYGVVRTTELIENIKVSPIVIKSVMDYTEQDKTDKDKENAAYLSACFTYFLIKDHL